MNNVVIVGCGDIGERVAVKAIAEGAAIHALVRREDRAKELRRLGFDAEVANLDLPASLPIFPTRGAVLYYFAPPPGGGVNDPRVRNFLSTIAPGAEPSKIIYISTSGVYGNCRGEIVTEETPVNPETTRAKRRYAAECAFREWGAERGVPVVVLRVTGIYGPGRLPYTQLQNGLPVLREEEAPFTNRIHAEDLAEICIAAAERGDDGDIFNITDGETSTMTHYFTMVADALGLPRPQQITMEEAKQVMPPLMLSYFSESRKMDNTKILTKLGVRLKYPTLQEGLAASVPPK